MELHARLIHLEADVRLVEVRASRDGRSLGSALAEARTVQDAEDLAITRLLHRLSAVAGGDGAGLSATGDAPCGSPAAALRHLSEVENGPMAPRLSRALRETATVEHGTSEAVSPSGPPVQAKRPVRAPVKPTDAPERAEIALAMGSQPSASALGHDAPIPDSAAEEPARPTAADPPQGAGEPRQAVPPSGPEPVAEPPSDLQPDPQEEPPADPEDWSQELTAVDLQLRRLGWNREQEGVYLQRAFGHPSRSRLTRYSDLRAYLMALEALERGSDPAVANVPLRRSELLVQGDALLAQLGWSAEQGRAFLERELNRVSRQQLNDVQLLQFNMLLEGELLAGGASLASVAADGAQR